MQWDCIVLEVKNDWYIIALAPNKRILYDSSLLIYLNKIINLLSLDRWLHAID